MEPNFVRGEHTLRVPMSLFKGNRNRLINMLKKTSGLPEGAFVVLQGGDDVPFNDTDVNFEFRQVCSSICSFLPRSSTHTHTHLNTPTQQKKKMIIKNIITIKKTN